MSSRFPLIARMAAEEAVGYQEIGMRIRARAEQVQLLVAVGFVILLIFGYPILRWYFEHSKRQAPAPGHQPDSVTDADADQGQQP